MAKTTTTLADTLSNHPPLLDGGSWFHIDDSRITAGDVLIKGGDVDDYELGDDLDNFGVLLVLNARDAGIVCWDAIENAYGWYDEMFLHEDFDEQCLAHIPADDIPNWNPE